MNEIWNESKPASQEIINHDEVVIAKEEVVIAKSATLENQRNRNTNIGCLLQISFVAILGLGCEYLVIHQVASNIFKDISQDDLVTLSLRTEAVINSALFLLVRFIKPK